VNPKVLLIILILLVILFVAGIGGGLLAGDDPASLEIRDGEIVRPAWLGGIDNLVPKGTVTLDDVLSSNDNAACLDREAQRLTAPPGMPCWYSLTNSARPRTVGVRLQSGASAQVELRQPVTENGSIGARETLAGGQCEEFDLFRRQSEEDNVQLRVLCTDLSGGCVLQIVECP
jgi:hypothetical protein